jgi:putative phosphoribosyl transferase
MATNLQGRPVHASVTIRVGSHRLGGLLDVPTNANGLVLFAHGSGSGRLSPRNQFVARMLQEAGTATLLFDLLDEAEAEDRANVFDIPLLAERLVAAASWATQQETTQGLKLGYFGASTGAAAALLAAAEQDNEVSAVVSRGGRPDLAGRVLPLVLAPTLLIVGGNDEPVIQLNRQAYALLRCEKELVIVPGATHLFPERGALERVADLAAEWFCHYFTTNQPSAARPK